MDAAGYEGNMVGHFAATPRADSMLLKRLFELLTEMRYRI
jgi:hypothetical protein